MIIKNIGNIISHNWKGDIDLLNIVLLGLAEDLPEKAEKYELHRLLGALLSSKLKVDEKLDIIGNEFQIPLENAFIQENQRIWSEYLGQIFHQHLCYHETELCQLWR